MSDQTIEEFNETIDKLKDTIYQMSCEKITKTSCNITIGDITEYDITTPCIVGFPSGNVNLTIGSVSKYKSNVKYIMIRIEMDNQRLNDNNTTYFSTIYSSLKHINCDTIYFMKGDADAMKQIFDNFPRQVFKVILGPELIELFLNMFNTNKINHPWLTDLEIPESITLTDDTMCRLRKSTIKRVTINGISYDI